MFFLVRRAFSAAPCNALSAERRDALHTNRHTGAGRGSIGDLRTDPLTRQIYSCRYLTIFIRPCIFLNICSLFESPTFICCFLLWYFLVFDSSAQEQRQKSSVTLRKSQETKTGFCLDTCRSVGLLLQTFIPQVILIQVYVSLKEE